MLCWQNKTVDEVLRYAKYCSDDIYARHRKLKEKIMWAQVKVAEQQEAQVVNQMQGVNQNKQKTGGGTGQTNIEEAKNKQPCHACGKIGHWKNECRTVQKTNPGHQNLNPQVQIEVSFQQPKHQQVAKSGATATNSPEYQ